jgi:4-diphosphocytidyl-2-C-methyl-D-erythritol kinase
MKIYKAKSFAKINLVLHVTGKLTKLHKIESIVKFIELHDLISIKIAKSNKHKISFNGRFSKDIKKDNTVDNLFKILDDKNLLNNKKFRINVKKNIPQEAGLGGGSMNAATILKFLIEKKFIKINPKKILQITNLIGSDVILGINPTSAILSSNGAVKRFLKTSNFYISF